jgi:hypothetical protein
MAAPEGTKFQVNYHSSDGTLVNLYATSITELETGLADLAMNAANIRKTAIEINGAPVVAAPTVATITQSFNAAPVASGGGDTVVDKYGNTWIYNLPEAPECGRGKMVLKHGTAQATGKPYKGFYDPASGPNWVGPKVPKESQASVIWA